MRPLGVITTLTIREILTGRRLATAVLLAIIPLTIVLAVIGASSVLGIRTLSAGALYRYLVPSYFHVLAILAGLMFGTSAVSDDEEDGSVVYLLVRPLRRGLIYLGKVAAAAIVTALTLEAALLPTAAVLALGGQGQGPGLLQVAADAGWLLLAALAYPSAFAAVATFARKPLQLVAGFFFFWEVPLAFAPTPLRLLTLSHHLLSLLGHPSPWHGVVTALGLSTPAVGALLGLSALVLGYTAAGSLRYERKEHLPPA